MFEYLKGPMIYQGPRKEIYMLVDDSEMDYVCLKNVYLDSNILFISVFKRMKDIGIPVSFQEKISDSEYVAYDCDIIHIFDKYSISDNHELQDLSSDLSLFKKCFAVFDELKLTDIHIVLGKNSRGILLVVDFFKF